jgi:alcohol dehydrogenase class IV
MGVSGRAQKWMERSGSLQKWAKAPKFGKAVKFPNGGIFGVLIPYVFVYLFRRAQRRGNVVGERRSLTETFRDAKTDAVLVRIGA